MQTSQKLHEILERLHATQLELEQELDRKLADKREQFQYSLLRGKVVFERGMHRYLKTHRIKLWRYIVNAPLAHLISAPIIYSVIVPLVMLDISLTVYQHICFRLYKIPRVRRADHIIIDRGSLAYLNAIEKMNCMYCGYGNGLIQYAHEITSRTEQYWCPIKHARRSLGEHKRVMKFFDYGDVASYRQHFKTLRKDWSEEASDS